MLYGTGVTVGGLMLTDTLVKYRMNVENPVLYQALNKDKEEIWKKYYDYF